MNDVVKRCLRDADSHLLDAHSGMTSIPDDKIISAVRCLLQAIEHLAEPAVPEKKAASYWCAKDKDGQIIGEGQKPTEAEALCWVSSWLNHGFIAAVGRTLQEARDLCDMAEPAKPDPQPTPKAGKPWSGKSLFDLAYPSSAWPYDSIADALNNLGVLDPRE